MQAERTDDAVPVDLIVNRLGGIAGLTAVVAVRDGQSATDYLDFNDLTFKAAGWTTRQAALADLGSGLYRLAGGLDVNGITNLPAGTNNLILEYAVSGAESAVTIETLQLVVSAHDVPAGVWGRSLAGFAFPSAGRVLDRIRTYLTNRNELNFGTQKLEAYEDNGVTLAQTWTVATQGGEPVAAVVGAATKRADPDLPL
jgi:hypothetical protein